MATGRGRGDEPGPDGNGRTLWCPWCGAPLPPAGDPPGSPADSTDALPTPPMRTCGACHTAIAPGTALTRPPDPARMRPHDPDARLPAKGPDGASPLPEGSPVPTADSMVRWLAVLAVAFAILSLLAYFVGAPVLQRVPGRATPTRAPTQAPAPPPTPGR